MLPVQDSVRRLVKDFGEREITPVTEDLDRKSPKFPLDLYRKMAKNGFLGYTTSSVFGGSDKSWLEYATLIEELSYYDASVAFILSIGNLAMYPIEFFGNKEQKQKYLKPMKSGKLIGAFALTEPGAGSDATNLKVQAIPDGDDLIIDGEKTFISSGDAADIVILFCQIMEGDKEKKISGLIVETEKLKGLTRKLLGYKMGLRGSTTAKIIFNKCRINKSNLLGEVGQGFKIAMKSLDLSKIAIAAQAVGLAQACFDRSINFAKQRKAFGGSIAKLQSIQWMIADMSTQIEAARMLTYKVAHMVDNNHNCAKESAQAKLFASEMVNDVAYKAVQIHGGYGYIGDLSDIEKLYRDARIIPIYEGTSEIQRMVIAKNELK